MKAHLFKLECLTNLHVGSGDVNFNIVDKEVEKDPNTHYPTIHASGMKGAFRDAYEGDKEKYIFGSAGTAETIGSGAYKFFDAKFLSRPLRVGGNPNFAYVPVTTVQAINDFLDLTSAFGCNSFGIESVTVDFQGKSFAVSSDKIRNIEGVSDVCELKADEKTKTALNMILGNNFAVAKDINDFDLPVIARNKLNNNKNLWYEEFVPHHSTFGFIVLTPDEKFEIDIGKYIQFGGNASVGYGYCKVSEF